MIGSRSLTEKECLEKIIYIVFYEIYCFLFYSYFQDVSYSGTLGYTNPEMEVEDPATRSAHGNPE